ncbi:MULTISPECIES: EAL domain-containing protein [Paracoccus]|jgi:EAL domain-containing protein (putative c-di-GMP-specific phosphodiesterase class I)|uniref:Diguanylate phosphodiesterase n=1 Tax=Paracoccus denitrificans (strain Pd 1222) TaxID=318586 RepID=A1B3M3_PARDP|nr:MULTISPECIES: EAL domain-containing protein [Paracoccus]ABL70117.1 diguanylate phosphodiesterase [Paracoccus denitrificans PD1222]MBB4628835.1 EAL domain-containing protein (putative c-di-GMP-specific phosphodiesterase class I) [Paracoccus denitrificans]MCU7429782.1 EAL domain-containing protein [Paracoccus denitrificans]MDK8874526.1 EAL domain-containing protein [Paracoccus sp. SSJ]QAR25489.1 EAL domain-containing protein [Paracoccus denitrificans]
MTDNIDSRLEMGSPLDFAVDRQSRVTMTAVRGAVSRGNAVLAYQPVVQADRPDHAAFHEGLIRIIDETGRIVPLRDFLPLAETTELGRQIDCLSLSLGLKSLAEEPSLRLSINMSARSIGYPAWLRILREGIAADDSIAERLILEITESSAMGMPDLVGRFMQELQAQGVSFALDDFGAGYTSFRYLRDFCFDMIKIDGQFVRDIATQRDNQVLARALQSIAHHFDMFTVAESVETADDAAFLIDMGIDCLQGYYFGAPTIMPPWKSPSSAARRG